MRVRGSRLGPLDGLRGIAVLAVLLFHGGAGWAPGGYLGVDVFFVLSGFLITRLLIAEYDETGRIDLRSFWSRRARRLAPALLAVLVVVAAIVASSASGMDPATRSDGLTSLAGLTNWRYVIHGGDYFALSEAPSSFQHLWSLAVEIQFYAVWPLLVRAVLRRGGARRLTQIAVGGALLSAAVSVTSSVLDVGGAGLYYRSDVRIVGVLVGCSLAAALAKGDHRLPEAAAWGLPVGLLTLGGLVMFLDGGSLLLFRGGLLVAVAAAGLVIAGIITAPRSLAGLVLNSPPLRQLGRVSYAAYLWHWPLVLLLTGERTGVTGTALLGVRLAATIAAAFASLYLVEQPMLRLSWPTRHVLRTAAIATVCTGVLLALLPLPQEPTAAIAATSQPVESKPRVHTGPPVRALVLGDSVGHSLARWLVPMSEAHDVALVDGTISGCGVIGTGRFRLAGATHNLHRTCRAWESSWKAHVRRQRPEVVLVVLGRHEVWDTNLGGGWTHLGERAFDVYVGNQLETAIRIASGTGASVLLATAPYFLTGEASNGRRRPEDDPARVDRFNELVREAAARHAGTVSVLDFGARLSPGGKYAKRFDGIILRTEGVHLTRAGALWAAPFVLDGIVQASPR